MPAGKQKRRALVLSGGGARGAYEAGVLHYLRTKLPAECRARPFHLLCGSSVGAINTSFMAATADDLGFQGRGLWENWKNLRREQIYDRGARALLKFLAKSAAGLMSNVIRRPSRPAPRLEGFFNPAPFFTFLRKLCPWGNISRNIQSGLIDGISVVATNVFTGQPELFMEKGPSVAYTGDYTVRPVNIGPHHVMASAAIPVVFPAAIIRGVPYIDGSLRLNTPISPAIQMGADDILVIGTTRKPDPALTSGLRLGRGERPPMGMILGRIFNSIFLDRLEQDVDQLEFINRLIGWSETLHGPGYLDGLNALIAGKLERGEARGRGIKKINLLRIQPSTQISEVFRECYARGDRGQYSLFERFLSHSMDVDPRTGVDFLSYISFFPGYLSRLLEMGYEDARARHDALAGFLAE